MIYLYVYAHTHILSEINWRDGDFCYYPWFSCIAFFISVEGLLHSNAITENYIHQSFYLFNVIGAQKCLKLTDTSRAPAQEQ